MNASTKSRSRSIPLVQPLENRRLLSGSWTTVDSDPTSYDLLGMAADKSGNVYAVGTDNSNNANLRQESGGVWSTALTVADGGITEFNCVATDTPGNVFIAGSVIGSPGGSGRIWERRVGQSGLTAVDTLSGGYNGIATDAAGDVFATGSQSVTTTVKHTTTTTNYAIVRKFTPAAGGSFIASTSVLGTTMSVSGITVIDGGAAAGVYAVGSSGSVNNGTWEVFKSNDGGSTWSQVDQFPYEAGSTAYTVTGGAAGNVYVAGEGSTTVVTGYSRNGKPIYSNREHWIVRKSFGGNNGSWSTVDDYLPAGDTQAYPAAMTADLAGNVYVAGSALPTSGVAHAIIRTNADGGWSTSDDFTGRGGAWTYYSGLAVDSTGTLYAGGAYGDGAPPTFVRSMPGPLPLSPTTPATLLASPFSSTSISAASPTTDPRLVDELFPA